MRLTLCDLALSNTCSPMSESTHKPSEVRGPLQSGCSELTLVVVLVEELDDG